MGRALQVRLLPAYPPSYSPEDEVTALKNQASYFEEALRETRKRIEEIRRAPLKRSNPYVSGQAG